jgi:hypothetical protein
MCCEKILQSFYNWLINLCNCKPYYDKKYQKKFDNEYKMENYPFDEHSNIKNIEKNIDEKIYNDNFIINIQNVDEWEILEK